MDWIDDDEHRDERRALVYTVMNFQVPRNGGKLFSRFHIVDFPRMAEPKVFSFFVLFLLLLL
jgi:hypothetical protein